MMKRGDLAGAPSARLFGKWTSAPRRSRRFVLVGISISTVFLVLGLFGDIIAPYGADQYRYGTGNSGAEMPELSSPSSDHPFGTTGTSLDVLSRVIHGTQSSLMVIAIGTSLALVVGTVLGLLAGVVSARVDRAVVFVMDALYVFPPLLLALVAAFALQAVISPGVVPAAIAVGAVYVPQYYRIVRTQAKSLVHEDFAEAGVAMGVSRWRLMRRYLLPNVAPNLPVIFSSNAGASVLTLAGLGFLGYGVQFPDADWGLDISRAITEAVSGVWWTSLFPGLAIVLLVTGLTMLGEGLNDVLNPLLRTSSDVLRLAGRATKARSSDSVNHRAEDEPARESAVSMEGVSVSFAGPDGVATRVVNDVSLSVPLGSRLGVVGESGSGKTTLLRAMIAVNGQGSQVTGAISVLGTSTTQREPATLQDLRLRRVSFVFQDPMARLNPLLSVNRHFSELLALRYPDESKEVHRRRMIDCLRRVGIPPSRSSAYPHQLSGGMQQRAMIALAIATEPRLILADEPTTALDLIVQAQILELLRRLCEEDGVSLVLVSHDIAAVAQTCDTIAVMYAGHVVEHGPTSTVLTQPRHPYTKALLECVIQPGDTEASYIRGNLPSPGRDPVSGCAFADRCPIATADCSVVPPELTPVTDGVKAACLRIGVPL